MGDVVDANIKVALLQMKFMGDAFNIGSGKNYSINEITNIIGGDKKHIEPVLEPKETLSDIGKANYILKYSPKMNLKKWIYKNKSKNIREVLNI